MLLVENGVGLSGIAMNSVDITYIVRASGHEEQRYPVRLDAESLDIIEPAINEHPDWARLSFHQCPSCTLDAAEHEWCPLALHLVELNRRFAGLVSHDPVELEVRTAERRVIADTTAQKAISSLVGLLIPCSGCPHTRVFRPMARFHLPLSSELESIYRVSSMYLLAQYFVRKGGRDSDLDLHELEAVYRRMQEINRHAARRLLDASETDSMVNAVVVLDTLAKTLPYVIEESINELRNIFAGYVEEDN